MTERFDFAAWIDRNGYRLTDAAAALGMTMTSISRIKSGSQVLSTRTQAQAQAVEAARTDEDADLSHFATTMELSDLCESVPYSVVTGMTAAAMLNWTTASTHVRYIALPEFHARRKQPDRVFAIPCALLPDEVRVMRDEDGRVFRIATNERIVVDCVRYDVLQGVDHVREVVSEALDAGVQRSAVRTLAARYGEDVLAKLDGYLSEIG